ncbi:MAG: ComEA family DNA-binding protein [Raoultibacter sp.]
MSFQETAQSFKAKAHVSAVKTPVLIGITVVVLIILFCCLQGLCSLFSSQPFQVVSGDVAAAAAGSGAGAGVTGDAAAADQAAAQGDQAPLVVHVGGAVVTPGVYELPVGTRVGAAIDAAGGFAPGAASDALNCARVLEDGEQVIVPLLVPPDASTPPASSSGPPSSAGQASAGKININSATLEELDSLAGVGPATAQRIIADREAQGPFKTIKDLQRVSGIGEKKYAALADAICV